MSNITGLSHLRYPHQEYNVSPFGGITVGYDLRPGDNGDIILYTAVALCAPTDNYNRKVARQIVEGRIALRQQQDVNAADADSKKRKRVAERVSVNVLNEEFFGKKVELKQTSKGVYYIPKDEFNLHDVVMNSVVEDFVRSQAVGRPYGPFLRGQIVRNGGFTLLVINLDTERLQQAQEAYDQAHSAA